MAAVVSPVAGTRTEPKDNYRFVRGTTATFKITFLSNDEPITVDAGTVPVARILEPTFLNKGTTMPNVVATLEGSLVPGQQFEYEFKWDIPLNTQYYGDYIVSYEAAIGGMSLNYGDEFFEISPTVGQVSTRQGYYATVDDIRKHKFNIDSYLPAMYAKDTVMRNNIIMEHLKNATTRLREELNLAKSRGNSENYRLFCIYYTIWSLLLASRGDDGSAVSDSQIRTYKAEWQRILDQEKRESVPQGISLSRG